VPNFNLEKKIYTTKILSILFPSVIFTSISFVLAAILQSFGNFTISSIMSLISNLFIITYLILFKKKYGLIGVALSMLIGWNLQFIIQIPSIQKTCFKYKFFFDLKNSAIIESFKMSYYVLISSWIQPLCYMINMRFASKMGEGTVSSFDLSNNIFLIIVGIFSYSVSNFMFPKISKLNFKKEQEKFSKIVSKFISFILYIISFISSIFLSFPHQIIKIVYARGNFDEYSSKITAISLFYLNFGMIASAVCEILNKSFYAVKNGIIPMISSILGIITNFILMLFFVIFLKLKIIGISLSTALSIVVSAIYLIFSFHKNIKFFNLQKLILNLTKIFLCNLITFLIYNFFYFAIEKICSKNFISLKIILSSTFGLIIYLGLSEIFKIEEFIEIKRYFRRKIND
jgi:putative peptidoglycan lipid II flippase